jgi:hypothetical protein
MLTARNRIENVRLFFSNAFVCAALSVCLPIASRADVQSFAAIGTGTVTYDSISWDWTWSSSSIDYSAAGYCTYGAD